MDPLLILIIMLACLVFAITMAVVGDLWDERTGRKSRPQRGSSFDRYTNF